MSRQPALASLLGEAEQRRIAAAVAAAERDTSGEIVPYVVGRCDDYESAVWRAATLLALLAALLAAVAATRLEVWGVPRWAWIAAPPAAGAALGVLLTAWIDPLRRLLVAAEELELRARRRAALAFLEEEVFATRDRTGILIFVALFEHRVVILGDSGIHAAVPETAWRTIAEGLVRAIRERRTTDGLVEAIGLCGALLAEHRLAPRPDDVDELADMPRLEER